MLATGDRHFDQYCTLVLRYLFNPIVSSLQGIQKASELKKVRHKLNCEETYSGSLLKSSQVFNSQLLRGMIEELGEQLEPITHNKRLANVPHILTLVEGSLPAALPLLVAAMLLKDETGNGLAKWRL